ncbi:hypothetical protein [Eubacterium oxidoreducens]|uniref:Uncharacterized protein n=1 Tax=Eubacterium oxidoreducens TaxID=1732 RepID=A0A1G6BLZ3_EUBOX|nr:hypothetical protein [Eubacterium oxidoreducens]SDB21614.1 hypothetical protein SAMN02910417_01620 [Eubacterium oxidoreducens]
MIIWYIGIGIITFGFIFLQLLIIKKVAFVWHFVLPAISFLLAFRTTFVKGLPDNNLIPVSLYFLLANYLTIITLIMTFVAYRKQQKIGERERNF